MKKGSIHLLLACLILVITVTVFGNESYNQSPILAVQGKSIDSFVPDGWKLIKNTSGDLNRDGLDDIAGVIEYKNNYPKDSEEAPSRILLIALQEKDHYRLSVQTEKAILTADQGGVWGDPLESLSVNRGSILINFYGGSNYRWAYRYRFRYQNKAWYLIGATITSYFTGTGEGTTEDYNLLTGFMIVTTIDKNGKSQEKTIHRGKKELLNLKDFDTFMANEDKKQF